MDTGRKTAPQKKREIHYALAHRDGAIFLVQRERNARLMAGMWELPEVARPSGARARANDVGKVAALKALRHLKTKNGAHADAGFTLRHSITVTDYTVRVWRQPVKNLKSGQWISSRRLGTLAMTGLARKILRQAGLLG